MRQLFLRAAILALFLPPCVLPVSGRAAETWADWHTSHVDNSSGSPVFTVDGKPFFVYGAAFFYERIPRAQWQSDLTAYKALGINTIDLYVIWNWHEPEEGAIDFDGSTNSRRDLDGLMKLIHDLGFKVILRPGPVIRNEWKNGGYPGYLLRRPEYAMPLHDIMEGRYPATATYQNAHADAAAGEWMQNSTHRREAAAWLRTALIEVEPWSSDIIAVALDDDQGAYLDNDSWPAPHWHEYMDWLKLVVQRTAGTAIPLFINTFQMKVTASAPVWAWGNWYQSDAYRIGDHDLGQLAFSTGLLQTQSGLPLMSSEFQAGWLQGADEIQPRPAAPENTTLALAQMLQMGVHGVVNFPVQDTIDPAGWEAPWSNWVYAWDAAYALSRCENSPCADPRFAPTAKFGAIVRSEGPILATMEPRTDIDIAWLPSAYDSAAITNDEIARLADATIALQQRCRDRARTCRLVDLHFSSDADLRRSRYLVVPAQTLARPLTVLAQARLASLRPAVRVFSTVDQAIAAGANSATGGIADAALLVSRDNRFAALSIFNAQTTTRMIPSRTVAVGTRRFHTKRVELAPGDATLVPLAMPPQARAPRFSWAPSEAGQVALGPHASVRVPAWKPVAAGTSIAYAGDVFQDGESAFVLDNGNVRVVVLPDAGARAVAFWQDRDPSSNAFTSIGALRDDIETPLPPSARDYIAAYTHPVPAGTYNRPYACSVVAGPLAAVHCSYDAPDLATAPVRFEKTFTLAPGATTLGVDLQSSADSRSVSAISPALHVVWPADSSARHEDEAHSGYRMVTLHYLARRPEHLDFSLQGP